MSIPAPLRFPALADKGLVVLLGAVAFLLGCAELCDPDVWWRIRSGQWILEHGRVPHVDPFAFGSEGRSWFNLAWLFDILIALAYRAGEVGGLVLLTAVLVTSAQLIALKASRREVPAGVVVLCWVVPLALMSWRFYPRPEIVSGLYLAAYLAVLSRLDDRPALAWLLPLLQLFWVNTHSLFILGPIVLSLYLFARGGAALWQWRHAQPADRAYLHRGWRHLGAAAATVAIVCLANPYGLEGVLFPLVLYPQATASGNFYKGYIVELFSLREYLNSLPPGVRPPVLYIEAFYLILVALPLSFFLPAAWNAWRASLPATDSEVLQDRPSAAHGHGIWLGALVAVGFLVLVSALTLTGSVTNPFLVCVGNVAWAGVLLVALLGAGSLWHHSRDAVLTVLAGGLVLAGWMLWLQDGLFGRAGLFGGAAGVRLALLLVAVAGLPALYLTLKWGGSLFRILTAGAFAYLALRAMRNVGLLGMVSGTVLAWNFGEWACQLRGVWRPRASLHLGTWGLRAGVAALLCGWGLVVVTGRYPAWQYEGRQLGLRERPFTFAHEAVRFAGQPNLPRHALVYNLSQANLFVFHNSPEHKPLLDGRTAVPARQTFQTYQQLERLLQSQDPGWVTAMQALGEPLVLLGHHSANNPSAEAALLLHPDWRCIYFDALAAVFVPRSLAGLEDRYSSVDFAARHFASPSGSVAHCKPGVAFRETQALYLLAKALNRPAVARAQRLPVLFAGINRATQALQEETQRAYAWTALGSCLLDLRPDNSPPPSLVDEWDAAQAIPWAQATYCYCQALALRPADPFAMHSLYDALAARQLLDAQLAVGDKLVAAHLTSAQTAAELRRLRQNLPEAPAPSELPTDADPTAAILKSARRRLPEAVLCLAQAYESRGGVLSWNAADVVAKAYLQLGRPAEARRIWERAAAAPSRAARLCRLAATFWIERAYDRAAQLYREALAAHPGLAEAGWGLAMLAAQRGQAEQTLRACRECLRLPLPLHQQTAIQELARLVRPYVAPTGNHANVSE